MTLFMRREPAPRLLVGLCLSSPPILTLKKGRDGTAWGLLSAARIAGGPPDSDPFNDVEF
jgi:hypothetical protein